jgi:predicted porin
MTTSATGRSAGVHSFPLAGAACATLALLAGPAAAQDAVTIYGRLDLGVQVSTKTAASKKRLVEVANGGIRPSILGFKGGEDLGGGLRAFYNLEHHMSADTGVGAVAGAYGFWRRQANVGLSGGFGAVTLGRQYSPALLQLLPTEPRAFKENFSGLYPYALNQIPPGNTVNDLGIFLGNAISYSNAFGPVSVGAAFAASEGTGRTVSGGLSYSGPVIVSLAYQKIDGSASANNTKLTGFGLGAPLGPVTVKGQWLRIDENRGGVRIAQVDSIGVGVDVPWEASNTFNASYYNVKDKKGANDRTNTLVLSNDYALSKRTTVYVQGAFANPSNGATLRTTVIANGVRAGSSTSAYNAGVSHNF